MPNASDVLHIEKATLDVVLRVQSAVELSTSLICFVCNVYCSCRIGHQRTLGKNLRYLLIFANAVTALMTLIHPILINIPPEWYALSTGHPGRSCLIYGLYFLVQVCCLQMDTKYLLIAVERRIAFRHRSNYEHRDGSLAIMLSVGTTLIFTVFICIKVLVVFKLRPEASNDDNLLDALNLDRTVVSLIYVNVVAEVAWLYAVCEFSRLKKYVGENWYAAQSLTESYQIKEIGAVVEVIRPILIGFTLLMISAGSLMSSMLFLHFYFGLPLAKGITQAIANMVYILIGIYNIFSVNYVLWFLPAMRAALISDVRRILCRRNRIIPIKVPTIDWRAEREDHFQYLRSVWA